MTKATKFAKGNKTGTPQGKAAAATNTAKGAATASKTGGPVNNATANEPAGDMRSNPDLVPSNADLAAAMPQDAAAAAILAHNEQVAGHRLDDHPSLSERQDFRPLAGEATKPQVVFLVEIKRGLETVPAEMFPWEVKIQKLLHLPENVKVINEEHGEVDIPDDAEVEYRRLLTKYGVNGRTAVERVYRDADDLGHAIGLRTGLHGAEPVEAVITDNRRKPAKKAAK